MGDFIELLLKKANKKIKELTASQAQIGSNVSNRKDFPTIILMGDSITNQNGTFGVSGSYWSYKGYFFWANLRSGGKFNVINEAGVGGDTTAEMLARFATDVLAYKPNYVSILGGTNDISQDEPVEDTIANLTAMYTLTKNNGSNLIICTVPPSAFLDSAARIEKIGIINNFIRNYALTDDSIILCDWWDVLVDVDGKSFISTLTDDGVHPNYKGAFNMGYKLYNCLNAKLGFTDNNFLTTSVDDPNNILVNGLFIGDTSGLADGWTKLGTASKNVYTDTEKLLKYNEQLINRTTGVDASVYQYIELPNFEVGRKIQGLCRIRVVDGATYTSLNVTIRYYVGETSYALTYAENDTTDAAYMVNNAIHATPIVTIPLNATKLMFTVKASALTGTIAFSNATLRYVD